VCKVPYIIFTNRKNLDNRYMNTCTAFGYFYWRNNQVYGISEPRNEIHGHAFCRPPIPGKHSQRNCKPITCCLASCRKEEVLSRDGCGVPEKPELGQISWPPQPPYHVFHYGRIVSKKGKYKTLLLSVPTHPHFPRPLLVPAKGSNTHEVYASVADMQKS